MMIVTAELNAFGESFVIKIDNIWYTIRCVIVLCTEHWDWKIVWYANRTNSSNILWKIHCHATETAYINRMNACILHTVGNSDKSENFNLWSNICCVSGTVYSSCTMQWIPNIQFHFKNSLLICYRLATSNCHIVRSQSISKVQFAD